ncbi:ECF transporter S component [Mycoplasma sp. Pen4]|uniref:ECF transporter S component n=1 Tax=Mycoplasma sp. Pen4 TaxID=640330 RepID=UPI001653F382|nr:ECF transporter S component [Mycoplasma sp. Pen4]QNM93593.1 ECF transporter S component [Mycoplasma sp. Pen4]
MKRVAVKRVNKIKNKLEEIGLIPKWTIRNMVFVAILIAISVSFTVVAAQIIPIANIPSFKFAFIGLPVKITGFIFGPVIGVFVGIISDLLSLLFVPPAGYTPVYTLATAVNGLVAGIFGMYFMHFLRYAFSKKYKLARIAIKINMYADKYKIAKAKEDNKKATRIALKIIELNSKRIFVKDDQAQQKELKNIYFITGILFMLLAIAIIVSVILSDHPKVDEAIQKGIIKDKYSLLAIMTAGMMLFIVFITVARFKMNTDHFLVFVPIIVFSAFLELINVPILSYADLITLGDGDTSNMFVWITQHILTSPVKIWFNVFVIYYSYSIISRLITKGQNLSY